METLQAVLPYLIGIALVATLAVLAAGIVGMSRGSDFYRRHANTLMRLRVGLQAVSVALLALYFIIVAL